MAASKSQPELLEQPEQERDKSANRSIKQMPQTSPGNPSTEVKAEVLTKEKFLEIMKERAEEDEKQREEYRKKYLGLFNPP